MGIACINFSNLVSDDLVILIPLLISSVKEPYVVIKTTTNILQCMIFLKVIILRLIMEHEKLAL